MNEFRIDLSATQQTPMGEVLNKVYFHMGSSACRKFPGHTGYPYNGGRHTFRLKGSKEDIVTTFEALEETVAKTIPSQLAMFQEVRKYFTEAMERGDTNPIALAPTEIKQYFLLQP